MKNRTIVSVITTFMMLGMFAGACSAPAGAPTPTVAPPTLVAPTSAPTAVPPTDTPIPAPTAASALPTSAPTGTGNNAAAPGNLPQDLANAVNKTKEVKAVRFELSSNVSATQNGQLVKQPPVTGKGASNGTDSDFSFSGLSVASGAPSSFEIIQVGGATYIKGALGVPGLDANTWYQFPKELGNVAENAPSAHTLLSGLNPDDFRKGDFKATGIEVLDLLPCQVWTASNSASLAEDFGSLGGTDEVNQQLKAVDKSDFKIWTCADGYMHQITGHVEGHDPEKPTDKAIADITFHIYDFNNAAIAITAPANAQPFAIPGIGGTPTP